MTRRFFRVALALTGIAGGWAALAGRWPDAWLLSYVAVAAATVSYAMIVMDDDLARERFRPPERGADALSLRYVRLLALAHMVAAALDTRWHIAPPVPASVRVVALVVMGLAFLFVFRAMRDNRFFSAVVRIQRERGHRVIDTGLYGVIRHPGYAGMIVGVPMSGLALGSWVGFVVAGLYSALILRRVVFEDGFLHEHLEGYARYAARVRHRLVPGVW
jgi:protein-S-isoprenylcysteine O-methyltransferase Ste14